MRGKFEELWNSIITRREEARERKRAGRADTIRQALTLLEDLRRWNLGKIKSRV